MDAHLPLSYFFVGADFSAEGAEFSAEIAVSRSHALSTHILLDEIINQMANME